MGISRNRRYLAMAAAVVVFISFACGTDDDEPAPAQAPAPAAAPAAAPAQPATAPRPVSPTAVPAARAAPRPKQYNAPPPMHIDPDGKYTATFHMAKGGEFDIELFAKDAPMTVNNFVFLARDGYYDGVTFHRVIRGFMAQGGDPAGTGTGGPGYEFDNELTPDRRHDTPGVLSMANKGARGARGTNGSQFFITFVPTPALDGYNPDGTAKDCSVPRTSCHTVFGRVVKGMDIVNAISPRDPGSASTPGDAIRTITITEG